MELTPLLKIIPFRGMSETELASLLFGGHGSVRRFASGDFIALQGQPVPRTICACERQGEG